MNSIEAQSFPTPMEEPKKVLRAQYLGSTEVHVAVGMNTINDAVEKVISETNAENWPMVNVSISPSMIAVRPTGVSRLFLDIKNNFNHIQLFAGR